MNLVKSFSQMEKRSTVNAPTKNVYFFEFV